MQPNFMYICGYVVYCFSSPVAQEIIHKIKCSSLGSIQSLCCVASLEFLLLHYSHQIKAKNKKCWCINSIYQQLVFECV